MEFCLRDGGNLDGGKVASIGDAALVSKDNWTACGNCQQ